MSGDRSLTECNGIRLKALFKAGIKCFELRKNQLDEINVFPVPDGDTGRNMYNTFLAIWQSVEAADKNSACSVVDAAQKGAFVGARGCSGIILSSMIRGFAEAIKDKDIITQGILPMA